MKPRDDWVIMKGIDSPSLDPLEIGKEERFGFSLLRRPEQDLSVTTFCFFRW